MKTTKYWSYHQAIKRRTMCLLILVPGDNLINTIVKGFRQHSVSRMRSEHEGASHNWFCHSSLFFGTGTWICSWPLLHFAADLLPEAKTLIQTEFIRSLIVHTFTEIKLVWGTHPHWPTDYTRAFKVTAPVFYHQYLIADWKKAVLSQCFGPLDAH